MSTNQIAAIETSDIGALGTSAIAALTPADLNSLSSDQMHALSTKHKWSHFADQCWTVVHGAGVGLEQQSGGSNDISPVNAFTPTIDWRAWYRRNSRAEYCSRFCLQYRRNQMPSTDQIVALTSAQAGR